MNRVQMFALAGVLAGALGAVPAYASDNAGVYEFLAAEKARALAAAATVAPGKAPAGKRAAVADAGGTDRASRSRPSLDKPSIERRSSGKFRADKASRGKAPRGKRAIVAPPALAAVEPERVSRTLTGGQPLGYHQPARERYRALIAKHAAANGVPFALGDAVVRVESRYQPRVSNGGAVGLMQIKPATARGMGYRGGAGGLMEPETNLMYGMKYLGQAYRLAGGDTCGTVMRYQSGHYARRINRANLAYCAKVRTIAASLAREKVAQAGTGNTGTVVVD
ncbi:soluble lytic murein transglycosylase-like protein [Pseudochelatococcus lubricantis]|uniref:Soluble lytic murein transglycosylase-like protein n=1 Tax=Pseudochelatococcus lubricantis TaxID=1538102 RepID=A0ABX0V359_9HYPH|nr:transglycosylase SLT domain-containing protein [Pseudochelatococcus lubricantis]NIJ59572.1 soluble lytic murein transglycosylase-like protein [Pseudochelatococcus lubricantis]